MSTTEQNKAVIQQFLDAWNRRQPEALDDLVVPNVVRHCQATPTVIIQNRDQLKDFMRQDTAVFPNSVQTLTRAAAEDDLVDVWCTYEGTQRGPLGPLPAAGGSDRMRRKWQNRRVVGDLGQRNRPAGARPPQGLKGLRCAL